MTKKSRTQKNRLKDIWIERERERGGGGMIRESNMERIIR